MKVAFGSFELDTDAVELRELGQPVPLEPKVFDVLAYLVRHRDRVVPKEELLDELWGGRFVSESALSSCIRHVRRVVGDDGSAQRFVRTAHGRGYRFVAPVIDAAPDASAAPRWA
ncbi:MAG: transcriptional regulator, partial [Ilumatobacteraceae bacterium]